MGEEILVHHGIKGQKWGVRRFQNLDGSRTAEGRQRYGYKNDGKDKPTREEIKNARKTLTNEKSKLVELKKARDRIETSTLYDDEDMYDLYLDAQDYWNSKEGRMTTKEEDDARWAKFDKAYNKALDSNPEYKKLISDIEQQKIKVDELEKTAWGKTGEEYAKDVIIATEGMAAVVAVMAIMNKIMK